MDRKKVILSFLINEKGENAKLEEIHNIYGDVYDTPIGEFLIATDEEADKYHKESIESFVDECSIYGFNKKYVNYIIDNFLETDGLLDYIYFYYESYFHDIKSESSLLYDNRMIQEITELLISHEEIHFSEEEVDLYLESRNKKFEEVLESYDVDDIILIKEISTYFNTFNDNEEHYIEKCIKWLIEEYHNPIDWLRYNYGDSTEEIMYHIKEGNITIDYEGLSKWVIELDGRGHSLASYDGNENEYEYTDGTETETFYIYQIN